MSDQSERTPKGDQNVLNLILANQDEIKTDLKEVKSEVKKINGRVTKLETDRDWRMKYIDYGSKLLLVGGGIIVGMIIEQIIKVFV